MITDLLKTLTLKEIIGIVIMYAILIATAVAILYEIWKE